MPVDVIIWATGFAVQEYLKGLNIYGSAGGDLSEIWQQRAEAYLGTMTSGFPNLFFLTGPNTGLGTNSVVVMIEAQVGLILDCLRLPARTRARRIEVRPEAQRRYNDRLQERLRQTVWNSGGCRSWYLDDTGHNYTLWPGTTAEFRSRTASARPKTSRSRREAAPERIHGSPAHRSAAFFEQARMLIVLSTLSGAYGGIPAFNRLLCGTAVEDAAAQGSRLSVLALTDALGDRARVSLHALRRRSRSVDPRISARPVAFRLALGRPLCWVTSTWRRWRFPGQARRCHRPWQRGLFTAAAPCVASIACIERTSWPASATTPPTACAGSKGSMRIASCAW